MPPSDQILRVLAAVVAVCVFAYPHVSPAVTAIRGWLASKPSQPDPVKQKMKDVETILGLSARFSAAGSKEGVDLCQKLIDAILKPSK